MQHICPEYSEMTACGIAVLNRTLLRHLREEMKYIKYFDSSSGNRIHNFSRLQSHACVRTPRQTSNYFSNQLNSVVRLS